MCGLSATGLAPVSEKIVWVPTRTKMPDADMTVLVFVPQTAADTEDQVMEGFYGGEQWFGSDGWPLGESVTWWADKPVGPGAKQ